MIVDMEASIEISKPVAAIFAAKMLVARAATHAHEPGSGDKSSTGHDAHLFLSGACQFLRTTCEYSVGRARKRERVPMFPVSFAQSRWLDV